MTENVRFLCGTCRKILDRARLVVQKTQITSTCFSFLSKDMQQMEVNDRTLVYYSHVEEGDQPCFVCLLFRNDLD